MNEELDPQNTATVIREMYEECVEEGLAPKLTRQALNMIRLAVDSERVQVTVTFVYKSPRQGWMWNSSKLLIDGAEQPLSDGASHLVKIMEDPDAYLELCRSGVRKHKSRHKTRHGKDSAYKPKRRVNGIPRSEAVSEEDTRIPGKLRKDLAQVDRLIRMSITEVEEGRRALEAEAESQGLGEEASLEISRQIENPDPFTWYIVLTTQARLGDEVSDHHCAVHYRKVGGVWKRMAVLVENVNRMGTYLDEGAELEHALRFVKKDYVAEKKPEKTVRADTSARGGFQSADVRRASVMRV